MSDSNGWRLERYRPLLRVQVRQMQLDPRLRRRFDESDLVQEALLRAHAGLPEFRGDSEAALLKWLGQILASVLTDAVRRERARKRDVALEQSLDAAAHESSARLEEFLAADGSSPAEQVERQEQLLRLAAALDGLPDDYRDVILRRDLMAEPVAEIASQMGRTERSVVGLLVRARRQLRQMLADPP
ncbi:MAG TPA: sigma-70 family RNA polymerase sigma factor [Gemmataceae bacterium]|nr:sigma-70 family RNA polymerase sigma factor [Gemmataceae bacterium]